MKQLKRQARELINDITENHCVPCEKREELGYGRFTFSKEYCNVHCAVGRDLKKLGEYLDKPKGDKVVKVAVKKVTPNKENCQDLIAQGKKNKDIAAMFGMSLANYYIKKKEWGLTGERAPKKENKSFGQHLADFVTEKESAAEMPIIQPDYSREIAKYEEQVFNLEQSVKDLTKKLEEVGEGERTNKILYQQNAELKQTAAEQSQTITAWISEYKALQKKYESLVTYTKEIM